MWAFARLGIRPDSQRERKYRASNRPAALIQRRGRIAKKAFLMMIVGLAKGENVASPTNAWHSGLLYLEDTHKGTYDTRRNSTVVDILLVSFIAEQGIRNNTKHVAFLQRARTRFCSLWSQELSFNSVERHKPDHFAFNDPHQANDFRLAMTGTFVWGFQRGGTHNPADNACLLTTQDRVSSPDPPHLPDGWHSLSGALSALEAYLEEDEEREEKGGKGSWLGLGFMCFPMLRQGSPHARTAQEEKGRRAVQNLKPWTRKRTGQAHTQPTQ